MVTGSGTLGWVAGALVVLAMGLGATVSVRAGAVSSVFGGIGAAVAMAVIAGAKLAGTEWASSETLRQAAGALVGGMSCAFGLGAVTRSLGGETAVRGGGARGPVQPAGDLIDVVLLVTFIAAIGTAVSAILAEALVGITPKDLLQNPFENLLGLLLGAPFLIAAWRERLAAGDWGNAIKVATRVAALIGVIGAAAVPMALNKPPGSLGYGVSIGLLAGGIAGGLFALVWQWTVHWTSSTARAISALVVSIVLVVGLLYGKVFNKNLNRDRPALVLAILAGAPAGYLFPSSRSRTSSKVR
jgi:hypothetical protein